MWWKMFSYLDSYPLQKKRYGWKCYFSLCVCVHVCTMYHWSCRIGAYFEFAYLCEWICIISTVQTSLYSFVQFYFSLMDSSWNRNYLSLTFIAIWLMGAVICNWEWYQWVHVCIVVKINFDLFIYWFCFVQRLIDIIFNFGRYTRST